MPGLSPERFRSRLAFDYRLVDSLLPHPALQVTAYARKPSARDHPLSREEGLAGRAMVYDVAFLFPVLVDSRTTTRAAKARFVLDAKGQYPFSEPSVQFLGETPWCPHVAPDNGIVCIGDAWKRARGKRLFAQLVLQIADIINLNEPDAGREYELNNDALAYWRTVMHSSHSTHTSRCRLCQRS